MGLISPMGLTSRMGLIRWRLAARLPSHAPGMSWRTGGAGLLRRCCRRRTHGAGNRMHPEPQAAALRHGIPRLPAPPIRASAPAHPARVAKVRSVLFRCRRGRGRELLLRVRRSVPLLPWTRARAVQVVRRWWRSFSCPTESPCGASLCRRRCTSTTRCGRGRVTCPAAQASLCPCATPPPLLPTSPTAPGAMLPSSWMWEPTSASSPCGCVAAPPEHGL
mmetsp:Transcript_29900/g.96481  ORF Transcript_29900/g.96481 Transcript_29900/m.96481 type:complete len:220 (-) Transcript_29900:504-1163(-)